MGAVPDPWRVWRQRFNDQANTLTASLAENERVPRQRLHRPPVIDETLPSSLQSLLQIGVRQKLLAPVDLVRPVPQNEPAELVNGVEGVVLAAMSCHGASMHPPT
jgi:hypothetical protein